jgi:uncharacterized protein
LYSLLVLPARRVRAADRSSRSPSRRLIHDLKKRLPTDDQFGVAFVRGQLQVSAVATREVSDESLLPLPDSPPVVWLRLLRRDEGVELFFSRDGRDYARVRIAYFPPVATVMAGMMAAAPEGADFQARFTGWRLRAV